MPDESPTREQLLAVLKKAPPRHAISDPRYWTWKREVEALIGEGR